MMCGKIIGVYCEEKYETNKLQCARRTQEFYNVEACGMSAGIALKFKKRILELDASYSETLLRPTVRDWHRIL
jgi:hypothetical protein